jgi:hypothetical protein
MVALGDLVVIVLAIGPKFAGSDPAQDDGFLRAIQICSTTSFGGEIKQAVPCCKFSLLVKRHLQYKRDTCRQNSWTFIAKFLPLCYWVSLLVTVESSGGQIMND